MNVRVLALTVDCDLHRPDIRARYVIRSDAFIRSRLLLGDGCQLQMFPLNHKFMSACGEGKKQKEERH